MKKAKMILFIISFLTFFDSVVAQGLTQNEINQLIIDLGSNDWQTVYFAIDKIERYKVVEAIPIIEENIWRQKCNLRDNFLSALDELDSPNALSFAKAAFDSAENCNDKFFIDPIDIKRTALVIEFKHDDYSHANYVFDLFNTQYGFSSGFWFLKSIIKNVPQYADSAKSYLYRFANDLSIDPLDRFSVCYDLVELYGEETIPLLLKTIKDDPGDSNRYVAFMNLCHFNYTDLHSLILKRLPLEPVWSYQVAMTDTLLTRFGTPQDIIIIKELIQEETNETLLFFLNEDLEDFTPPSPSTNISITAMVDSLSSYLNQCYNYTWIQDVSYLSDLNGLISSSRNFLQSFDSTNCAKEIKLFQESMELVHADSAGSYPKYVSDDAFKFLYYYPQYILDRLPEIPVYHGPIIGSLSPTTTLTKTRDFTLTVKGENFTHESIACWDGQPKETNFISDEYLEVKILKHDTEIEGIVLITVKDSEGNQSAAVEFNVFEKLPEKISPILDCVEILEKNKYLAWFGYENNNDEIVLLDHQSENKFNPAPLDRGQPIIFLPGKHAKVFSVEFNKQKLMWTLSKEKITVTKDSPPCN